MFTNLKPSLAPFILRVGLAGIFLYHSGLKLIHRGGTGWSSEFSTEVEVIVAWVEFVGGLALGLGLLSRLAAVGFTVIQLVAIIHVTGARGFVYVSHYGRGVKGYRFEEVGYEYNFALIVMCLALFVLGSGQWSLDYLIFHRRKKPAAAPATERIAPASQPVVAAVRPVSPGGSSPSA